MNKKNFILIVIEFVAFVILFIETIVTENVIIGVCCAVMLCNTILLYSKEIDRGLERLENKVEDLIRRIDERENHK